MATSRLSQTGLPSQSMGVNPAPKLFGDPYKENQPPQLFSNGSPNVKANNSPITFDFKQPKPPPRQGVSSSLFTFDNSSQAPSTPNARAMKNGTNSDFTGAFKKLELQSQRERFFKLLSDGKGEEDDAANELVNTPLFTQQVLDTVQSRKAPAGIAGPSPKSTQYGLIAGDINGPLSKDDDPWIYHNVSAPSSIFICGSQGSGKSHSLSCLLENALVPHQANVLRKPLTGVVFHYDTFISDSSGSPCEAAYLSSSGISVRVLCAPTNIGQMRRIYKDLPFVHIEPLIISEADLNTRRMMDLMATSSISGAMPLYIHVINCILRKMRLDQQQRGGTFNYAMFKRLVEASDLKEGQMVPLQQRLETLESFMHHDQRQGNDWKPKPGQLTIVDLSCPCVTAESACALFSICLSLFLENKADVGKIVALDEAHKYMGDTVESQALTESLLSTIRLQRHLGARVIIATQEPTISPKLLDLCSVTIVHRFTSPDWMATLKRHLAGASNWILGEQSRGRDTLANDTETSLISGIRPLSFDADELISELFSRIVNLRTGEALMFSPSAIIGVRDPKSSIDDSSTGLVKFGNQNDNSLAAIKLAHKVLKVRIRQRVTKDGGRSVMAN